MNYCNLDYLKSIIPEDNSFPIRILEMFLEDVPDSMKHILKAAAVSDWKEVYTYAHKIKPSVQLIGVPEQTMETLLKVVSSAKSGEETERLLQLITDLDATLNHIYAELEKELMQLKA